MTPYVQRHCIIQAFRRGESAFRFGHRVVGCELLLNGAFAFRSALFGELQFPL